jgi:hypothetical protein
VVIEVWFLVRKIVGGRKTQVTRKTQNEIQMKIRYGIFLQIEREQGAVQKFKKGRVGYFFFQRFEQHFGNKNCQ